MTTYLITGGAGFIGSNLADNLLGEGNRVVVIDNFNNFYDPATKEENISHNLGNENYNLYKADIRDEGIFHQIFNEHHIHTVIHLAAMAGVRPSIENPILYQDVNCMGTQNLLEAMKAHKINNLILASSSSVYGNCDRVPFKESFAVDHAISPYAATKKANEVMAHVYHTLEDMSVILLRFFTVYGPRQRPDLAINKFVHSIREDNPIQIFGDGSTSRDYTYIEDIVMGIKSSIEYLSSHRKVYEIINLGGSNPISLEEMIQIISRALDKKPIINRLPMQPGDVNRTYADISKARRLLNYEPKTTFHDGIQKYIGWLKT